MSATDVADCHNGRVPFRHMSSPVPTDVLDGWGTRLAEARTAVGKTQAALARELGVLLRTYQRWEAAADQPRYRRPSEHDQRRIAAALNTAVTTLFPRDDDEATLRSEYDQLLERVGGGCS